jgi:uncharacterized protein YjdB
MKRGLIFIIVVLVICSLYTKRQSISPSSATVVVGQSEQYTATCTYSSGPSQNCTAAAGWSTSNAAVATVVAGLANALTAGSATLTASLGGFTPTTTITTTAPLTLINGATFKNGTVQ